MESPLISVLMTSFNREMFIAEAINSVLVSTYKNLELIICDDCSNDATILILREFERKDNRVKVFVNEKNLGDYQNRNKAASLAKGKYLKYVDCDDYIYPWGLEILVTMMETYPTADWGLCSLLQFPAKHFPILLGPKESYEYHYFGPGLFHKAPLSSIIKRDVFEKAGGFSPVRFVGDTDMWHRLARKHNVLLMPDGIVWYREHENQESTHARKYLLIYEDVVKNSLTHLECPLSSSQVMKLYTKRKRAAFKYFLKSIIKMDLDGIKRASQMIYYYRKSNWQI